MRKLNSAEWRILLCLFVAGEAEMRPVLMKPFENGCLVCASDSHILLLVDKKYISDDYSTDKKTPDVSNIIPQANPKYRLALFEIKRALNKLNIDYDTTKVECPYCNDECEVEWEYTDFDGDKHTMWAECPCCVGSGYIPNGSHRYCEVLGNYILAYYVVLLYRVMITIGVDSVKITKGGRGQLCFNVADGINVIIMPCNLKNTRTSSIASLKATQIDKTQNDDKPTIH